MNGSVTCSKCEILYKESFLFEEGIGEIWIDILFKYLTNKSKLNEVGTTETLHGETC